MERARFAIMRQGETTGMRCEACGSFKAFEVQG